MAREKLKPRLWLLLMLSQDITTMATLTAMDMDMVDMDTMARGKLSPVITTTDTLMVMDMVDMDTMARERLRLHQDIITMDTLMATVMVVMVTMVKHPTIYLFQNFSKLIWILQNLVKRSTHLLKKVKNSLFEIKVQTL